MTRGVESNRSSIAAFPMGPHMRAWFGLSESQYKGSENSDPSSLDQSLFTESFLKQLETEAPKNENHLVDLLEELVGMNLPLLAIKLVDANPVLFPMDDFRAQLHYGNASMLCGDFGRAESAFIAAQKLVPEEPAPYVNLVQIYCHDQLLPKALTWCEAGLHADSDHKSLWEYLGWITHQLTNSREAAKEKIATMAKDLNSWAGFSYLSDLTHPEDPLAKLKLLEPFWSEGVRTSEFLIEYTAVLGMAGRYDQIPMIVWQVQSEKLNPFPWQLSLHLVQAFMGLGRDEDARTELIPLLDRADLPASAKEALQALLSELAGETTDNSN